MAAPVNDPDHGFCRDCLALQARDRAALRELRQPAACPPSGALPAASRAYRLRRLLRGGRKARQSGAEGQAGHHRRRQARRRLDRLLHRPHPRRALGHADVQGARSLPRGGRHPAGHGEICPRRPRGARHDAGADAAGRADLDRRGVSRSRRHRAAARPAAGAGARRTSRRPSRRRSASPSRPASPTASSWPRWRRTCASRAASR